MKELINKLKENGILGAMRSSSGEIKLFRKHGVADLYELLATEPSFLHGASVADRVIGKGAALLLIKGCVSKVYAALISHKALHLLQDASIEVTFRQEVPFIKNREGNGLCPVEALTGDTDSPEDAYIRIGLFLRSITH